MRVKKPKKFLKSTYSKFLRKSSVWIFNLWIVVRDGMCVQCKTKNGLSCGHFVSALCAKLRYNEDNCHCQCFTCNGNHEYTPLPYTIWILNKYGQEKIEYFQSCRGTSYKHSLTELENICTKYGMELLEKNISEEKRVKIKKILYRIQEYNKSQVQ